MPGPKAPRRPYTQEVLEEAIASVQDGRMNVTAASKHYNIPRQTLKDKISGKYATVCKMGRPSILTPEEEQVIVDWVIAIGTAGFPVSKEQLISSVTRLMNNLKRENPFSGGAPGEKWLALFTLRHPEISARVTQALTTSRANVTEGNIRQWFGEVREYFESKALMPVFSDPRRVFNCDETAFFLCPKGKKVFVKKGQKQVYTITGNDEKECLTVLFTANAAGDLAPPMIVYSYERVPSNVVQQVPNKWGIGKSENGWMTGETFFEFVTNIFHPWLVEKQIPRPVVLFLDGHTSHLTLHVSEFCSNHQIELISLYPNSTHILQPMDVAVFHPLKATWRKTVDNWRFESGAAKIKKEDFAPLLKKSIQDGITPKTVSSGFTTTGLATLDPDKINFQKLVKSSQLTTNKQPYTHSQWLVLRSHLTYLETKIGKDTMMKFKENVIEEEDMSLHKVWKERWRKRWFVLRHSGELPGQYYLSYYTDKSCRKLKGRIDLDQCEQVDAGLRFENRKQKYQHLFDVRTPKRTYYLAADSEQEMNKWVDCVCHVCGLKAYSQLDTTTYDDEFVRGEEETQSQAEESSLAAESPPISPTSTASGPYIPISECISGKPISSPDGLNSFLALQQQQLNALNRRSDTYDAPRRLLPPQLELRTSGSSTPPLQSPATDGESVFTDEEWTNPHPRPPVNWETFPRPSDSSADGDTPKPTSVVTIGKRFTRNLEDVIIPVAPPRPPKPSHLTPGASENSHNYSNIEDLSNGEDKKTAVTDETYDFPRSHNLNGDIDRSEYPVPQIRHCYTNAAPGKVNGDVFRYDFASTAQLTGQTEAVSPPASDSSSVAQYSNLPSPAVSVSTPPASTAPPIVNRGLKPGRKDSCASNEPSPVALPNQPPVVDRNRKPVPAVRKKLDPIDDGVCNVLILSAPPQGRLADGSHSLRRQRAAPSPTPHVHTTQRRNSDTCDDQAIYYCGGSFSYKKNEIQYLDLALDSSDSVNHLPLTPPGGLPSSLSPTAYKSIDFVKTQAFNLTRARVEEERKGGGKPVH